jgi:hypothetical protein
MVALKSRPAERGRPDPSKYSVAAVESVASGATEPKRGGVNRSARESPARSDWVRREAMKRTELADQSEGRSGNEKLKRSEQSRPAEAGMEEVWFGGSDSITAALGVAVSETQNAGDLGWNAVNGAASLPRTDESAGKSALGTIATDSFIHSESPFN